VQTIDLSHPIGPDMPLYPGTPRPRIEPSRSLAADGYVEHRLTLTTHVGTHVDAPAHLVDGGRPLSELPADRFVGRAVVLDPGRLDGGRVTVARLEAAAASGRLDGVDFLLLRTGWSERWGEPTYFADFPCLAPAAARWLVDRGVRGFGVDCISVDPMDDADLAVHHALLGAGAVIVENLANLAALPDAPFLFCALPLPVQGVDGSPVRAVAVLDAGAASSGPA
jgi:kynurenine formamidase